MLDYWGVGGDLQHQAASPLPPSSLQMVVSAEARGGVHVRIPQRGRSRSPVSRPSPVCTEELPAPLPSPATTNHTMHKRQQRAVWERAAGETTFQKRSNSNVGATSRSDPRTSSGVIPPTAKRGAGKVRRCQLLLTALCGWLGE